MKKISKNILSLFLTVVLFLSVFLSSVNFVYAQEPNFTVTAEAAILMEAESGKILYEKNSTAKMYPASMTKLLTAQVFLDNFNEDELITVGREINEVSLDSSKAGHTVGETISVKNLVRGLIIPSGNDSANVVAMATAKKLTNNDSISFEEAEEVFCEEMNKKAKELGAENSQFKNAHGYHDDNHYTTARDMALIAKNALTYPVIAEIASEKSYQGKGVEGSVDPTAKVNDYVWRTHNYLLSNGEYYYEYATGLKTGNTNEAGHCLAASARKEKEGKQTDLICVLFNSPDPGRWNDAKNLFEYGFNNFENFTAQKTGEAIEKIDLSGHNRLNGDKVEIVTKKDITVYINSQDKEKLKKSVVYKEEYIEPNLDETDDEVVLKAPISKDEVIGTLNITLEGETIATADVYTATDVEKSTIFNSIQFFFKHTLTIKNIIIFIIIIIIILFIIKRINKYRCRNKYRYNYKLKGGRRW